MLHRGLPPASTLTLRLAACHLWLGGWRAGLALGLARLGVTLALILICLRVGLALRLAWLCGWRAGLPLGLVRLRVGLALGLVRLRISLTLILIRLRIRLALVLIRLSVSLALILVLLVILLPVLVVIFAIIPVIVIITIVRVVGGADDHPRGETDGSRSSDRRPTGCGRRSRDVNCLRIVGRDVNHLRVGRLYDNHLLTIGGGLGFDLLLGCCLQIAGCQRLGAQSLDRIENGFLVGSVRLAERLRPIRLLGHHLDHLGKRRQRDVWRIEAGLQCSVLEFAPLQSGIFSHPGGKRLDRINIRGSRQNLKDEGIRVQGNRARQLIDRIRRGRRSCRLLRK